MKWEYIVEVYPTGLNQKKALEEMEIKLNELGEDGWELVSSIPMNAQIGLTGSTAQVRCIFKRKIED